MPGGNGTIVDANQDPTAVDNWALVTGTTVENIAMGNYAYAQSVQTSYDYIVDITVGGQTCAIGDAYDPATDTFSAPSNPYIVTVENDLASLMSLLSDALADASNLSSDDLTTAYNTFLSENSGSFTPNELTMFAAIYAYLAGGG